MAQSSAALSSHDGGQTKHPSEKIINSKSPLLEHNITIKKRSFGLFSLAVCSFGIGLTEFVAAGLLPEIADDFKISIPSAAFVTTGYAIGVGVSGPLVTATTISMPRKRVLIGLMTVFILGNGTCALASSFKVLMAGRVIASFAHGTFFGIGSVVATNLVPAGQDVSAISKMFSGMTLANLAGVPLGAFIGQRYGWRFAFWIIVIIGVLGLGGITALIPQKLDILVTNLRQELKMFMQPRVWSALFTTALGFGGLISSYTYIAPTMTEITGFSSSSIPWLIAIYAGGLVIGNIFGGRAADRALMPTLYVLLISLITLLIGFVFTAHYKAPASITLFLLGAVGFGLVSPLQKYVMNQAEGAPTLAATANISAFNLGIAFAVFLGGTAINAGLGYTAPSGIGAILTTSAFFLTVISNSTCSAICSRESHEDDLDEVNKRVVVNVEQIVRDKPKLPRKNLCENIMSFLFCRKGSSKESNSQGEGKNQYNSLTVNNEVC